MGVDAGGDAFAAAQENYGEAHVISMTKHKDAITRATEMAERYEARIAEQARLLGLVGKRVQKAIQVLPERPELASEILKGEHDE